MAVNKHLRAAFRKRAAPKELIPHGYQWDAANLLVSHVEKAYQDGTPAQLVYWLCMGMGLGKTVSTLLAFQHLKRAGFINSMLVVGPLRVATTTWPDEVAKWSRFSDLRVSTICGSLKEKSYALQPGMDIYTTNPESLPWIQRNTNGFQSLPWDAIVFDESTQYKNPDSGRSKLALEMVQSRMFPWIVELTGTPITNSYEDIFMQALLLDGGRRLGESAAAFRLTFGEAVQVTNKIKAMQIKDEYGAELMARVSDICTTMKAEQYLDMPDYIHHKIEVPLPANKMEVYDKLASARALDIDAIMEEFGGMPDPPDFEDDGEEEDGQVVDSGGALYNLLCQFASGRVYLKEEKFEPEVWSLITKLLPKVQDRTVIDIHSAKTTAVLEVIDQIAPDEQVMIAYKFQHERDALLKVLNKKFAKPNVNGLHGAKAIVSNMKHEEFLDVKDAWLDGDLRFLLIHGASAGHGLNLQGRCNTFIELSVYENLEWILQAAARVYRQGIVSSTFTHVTLAAQDTVEVTDILPRQDSKRERLEDFMETLSVASS